MTSRHDLHYRTALEQAALIRAGDISPVDLVAAYLSRIDTFDGSLHAWISVDPEGAMRAAKEAEREIAAGNYRGPLHGLPYGIKDQIHALGFKTTLGTRLLSDEEMTPPVDATVVRKLRDAGAILLGKQNLHEFGKGGTIDFPYGQPRNPWHPDYNASSSSTGSGIATAAGFCSFSIGEDTGGSVRGPASLNGVVGLRPTFGRVSRAGGVMHAYTTDTIGPMARTVKDAASVLAAVAGGDPRDPLSSDRPVPDYMATIDDGVEGLRLGVVNEMSSADILHPEVNRAFQSALAVLKDAGAIIENASLPLVKWAIPLQFLTADADVGAYFVRNYLRDRYASFDKGTRTRLVAAALVPATVYNSAMRARVIVRNQILEATRGYDALLCPSNVSPPKSIEASQERADDREDMVKRHIERRICNYPYSVANIPAMSVPMGFSKAELPLGLQIAARPFGEATVFRIGHAYEKLAQWCDIHPALERTLQRSTSRSGEQ